MTASPAQAITEEETISGTDRSILTRVDAHDIHAQVINLKGFLLELNRVIGTLKTESAGWGLEPALMQHIDATLGEDLGTVCSCLEMSIERLESKIDALSRSEVG